MMEAERPPLPPFTTVEAAVQKARLAEDAWNTRDPERVVLAYTPSQAPGPSTKWKAAYRTRSLPDQPGKGNNVLAEQGGRRRKIRESA